MDQAADVPCWSGFWFEIEGLGYLEIADSDQRQHRPPEGWILDSVSFNTHNSSQIFRYMPVSAKLSLRPLIPVVMATVCEKCLSRLESQSES